MQKVYYYPPASRLGYENPYSINFKDALASSFYVYDLQNRPSKMLTLSLLKHSLLADVFIVNWLESAPFLKLGLFQYWFAVIALSIIKFRKKKIVWMLHNIHPHNGNNKKSRYLQKRLFKESTLIVTHSKDAFSFARSKTAKKCLFFNHPVKPIAIKDENHKTENYDILIWGSILPYKGIYEFVSNPKIQNSNLKIRIIGLCRDEKLSSQIRSCCSSNILFENRRADFDELKVLIASCRYVVFPYIGECVSSSGALIDTLVLGGTPVGPNTGAFSDLRALGVCLTYSDFGDLIEILYSDLSIDSKSRTDFFKQNSWEAFVQQLISNI